VWASNPGNRRGLERSMPIEDMAWLCEQAGVAPVSLQHGPPGEAAAAWPSIAVWPQEDLADTAALVAELDLVITVDTLTAHLAGTLARKTWVLLPFAADWRWMCERPDSPWYPGVTLFRQSRPGDWRELAARVAPQLAGRLS
jgi:ADP-heptose:LPS heptosyltransferase